MSLKNQRNLHRSYDNPDTNNATYMKGGDAGSGSFKSGYLYLDKQEYYKHLDKLNSGWKIGLNWYNNRLNTYQMANDVINTLSRKLDLTSKERSRARGYYVNLDREKLGLSASLVAYCVCAYVVEKNDKNEHRRCHPNVPDETTDDLFRQVADSMSLRQKSIVSTYGKIPNRVPDSAPVVRDGDGIESHLHDDLGGGI